MKLLAKIDKRLAELDAMLDGSGDRICWQPIPNSPQEQAYYSPADELLFGGQAGGGKSMVIIGLALTAHKRSLILRKRESDLSSVVAAVQELTQCPGSKSIKFQNRQLYFGGCKDDSSKYKWKGQDHDLKAFDELSEFKQEDYEFISAWNRTSEPGQRCRIVATTNPPDTNEGRWIIERWAPWLDPSHPNPAQSGELRWYLGNKEVGGPDPIDGVLPRSRTFIRSRVEDNPYLMESGYDRLLDNLPDGIREKLRYGDFGFQMDDGPQQLIPTGWIEAAQQRYKDGNYNQDVSVRTIGCDPARGGKDRTVIAIREGDRVDYFSQPGKATPDGSAVVQQILKYWTPDTPINLDVIGIGSSVIDYLKDLGYPVTPVNFAKGSFKRDRSGLLKFRNLRTEVFWNLRDLLDPHWGHTIALPPDTAVLNELTSLTYKLTHGGVMVDSKDTIRAKLRMSCDIADAIALACYRGMSYISAF
ncbi:MAG: terminase [Candidatus Nanopelagicaceae bacterium]